MSQTERISTGRPDLPRRCRAYLGAPWLGLDRTLVAVTIGTFLLGWLVPFWHHPGWILGVGVLLGTYLGAKLGGAETREEIQEFTFALPLKRRTMFRLRFAAGLVFMLVWVMVSLAAIEFSWPQALWSLVVESGFTKPFGPWPPSHGWAAPMALTVTLCAYGLSFGLTSFAGSRVIRDLCVYIAPLLIGATVALGATLEVWQWGRYTGKVTLVALAALTVFTVIAAEAYAARKEAVARTGPTWLRWWVVALIVVLLALIAFAWMWLRASDAPPDDVRIHEGAAAPAMRDVTMPSDGQEAGND